MANVIVFTQAIRDAVRGKSDRDPFSEIEPVLMTDGRYYVDLKNVQVVDFETIRHLTFTLVRG
jgi:hypothetical protein